MSKTKTIWGEFLSLLKKHEKMASLELADGSVVSYEGELKAGETILSTTIKDETTGEEKIVPLAEGTHNLAGEMSGKAVVVDVTGKVLEIKEVQQASEEEQALAEQQEVMNALITKIHKLENDFKALKKSHDDFVNKNADSKKKDKHQVKNQTTTDHTSKLIP